MENPEDQSAKKDKKLPQGLVIPPKKPKLTKAERRALQEAQKAAKGQQSTPKQYKSQEKDSTLASSASSKQQQQQQLPQVEPVKINPGSCEEKKEDNESNNKTLELFSHLPKHRGTSAALYSEIAFWFRMIDFFPLKLYISSSEDPSSCRTFQVTSCCLRIRVKICRRDDKGRKQSMSSHARSL